MENKELKFGDEVIIIEADGLRKAGTFVAYSIDGSRCAVCLIYKGEIETAACRDIYLNKDRFMEEEFKKTAEAYRKKNRNEPA